MLPESKRVGDIENRPKTDIDGHQIKRVTPTNSHCGKSATVIITISNPRTKTIIESVVFMSKSLLHPDRGCRLDRF